MKKILWTLGVFVAVILVAFVLLRTPDTDAAVMDKKYSSPASRFLDLPSGDRIHYRDSGNLDGQALVLIHGANASLHGWEALVDTMKTDYRLISLDLPGHGLTGPRTDRDYSASVLTGSTLAVLDHLGVDQPIWVGNSMGGWLSWRTALSHPERVKGVVLISASGPPRDETQKLYLGARLMRTKFGRWIAPKITPRSIIEASLKSTYFDPALITPELIDRYWELLRYPGNRLAAVDRSLTPRNPEVWNDIGTLDVPVLILWGEEDKVTPMSFARKFKVALPHAQLITYPEVSHIAMEEAPQKVAGDISDWINENFRTEID